MVILAAIVLLLLAASVVFLIREGRHQGRREILGQVMFQAQEDRAFYMGLFAARREAEAHWEPIQAAQAAEAAARGEVVPIVVPLSVQHCQVSDHRKDLKSFGQEPDAAASSSATANDDLAQEYPARFNPFGDFLPPSPSSSAQPQQQVSAAESEVCPISFTAATSGIRSKLEDIFEPRQEEKQPDPPTQQVVQAEVHTADVHQKPSQKKRRAPPPPTLPKPKPEAVAAARGSSATSNPLVPLAGRATSSRRPPSPPRRSSSLRSLNSFRSNSLRRSARVPLKAESKLDLPTDFMEQNDLYTEEDQFVSYV